jgi:AcrR family transcriptional regulator
MFNSEDDSTAKAKILDAAGDVFGRLGYSAATIRAICRQAGVNVAAINYHFGGKARLYRTVVMDLIARTFARYRVDDGIDADAGPQDRLRAFIAGALRRLIAPDGLSGYPGKGQLVARELADPSPFLDDVIDEFIQPTAALLGTIVADILGPGASQRQLMRCQLSVIGQCFHYAMARPIISRLAAVDYADAGLIDELADHITCFSLAGLEAVRQSIARSGGPPLPPNPTHSEA